MAKILILSAIGIRSSDSGLLLRKAFINLGWDTKLFAVGEDLPFFERINYRSMINQSIRLFNHRFYRKAKEFNPDIILIYGSNWGLTSQTLQKLKNQIGCKLAIWEKNLYLWRGYQSESISIYDHFFCQDSYLVPLLQASFSDLKVHHLGVCCDPEEHCILTLNEADQHKYGADVCFLGTPHSNRITLFESLANYNLRLWGPGWEISEKLKQFASNEPIYGLKRTKIYNASKITVNLQSKKFQVNGLSERIFEAAACGCFVITESKPDLGKFFEIGEEIIVFESIEELKRKVKYYIDSPIQREQVSQRARQRVLNEHTYNHRAETILDIILN